MKQSAKSKMTVKEAAAANIPIPVNLPTSAEPTEMKKLAVNGAAGQQKWDLFDKVVTTLTTRGFPMIYFSGKGQHEGRWHNKEYDYTDEECIALVDHARFGYTRFDGTTVHRANWTPIEGHDLPKRPDSLLDKKRWPNSWPDGRPKDPWELKVELPLLVLTGDHTGRVVVFNVGWNQRAVVGELLKRARAEKRERLRRPRVKLTTPAKRGNGAYEPLLQFIEFTDNGDDIPGLTANINSDKPVDDEIPF